MSRKKVLRDDGPRGYDAPVSTQSQDLLGRWPIARAVYQLATTAPENWAVRIGLYGAWGSGKSTVLKFVEDQAKRDGHACCWFNPWGFSTEEEMLHGFTKALRSTMETELGVKAQLGDKARATGRSAFELLRGASDIAPVLKSVHGAGALADKMFDLRGKDMAHLAKQLKGKRVLFLVDDLDRAHPSIVPKVLFWVREILDLPGLSFILAFDPDRVVPALEGEHPGFDGREFLDKILDFQRWLPDLGEADVLRLALHEREHHADFIPEAVVRANAAALPQTPRSIRGLFRQLRPLAPEVSRHREGELNFQTLLLCETIRNGWPLFFERLRNEHALYVKLVVGPFAAEIGLGSPEAALDPGLIDIALQKYEKSDQKRLAVILTSLGRWSDSQSFGYHSRLLDQPRAVTHGEFSRFFESWKAQQKAEAAKEWIDAHASTRDVPASSVLKEILDAGIDVWDEAFRAAADALTYDEQASLILNAGRSVKLWRQLSDGATSWFPGEAIPTPAHLFRFASEVRRWCHFEGDPFKTQVDSAQKLIEELYGSEINPVLTLAPLPAMLMQVNEAAFVARVRSILDKRMTKLFLTALADPAEFLLVIRVASDLDVERLLVSVASPLWRGEARTAALRFPSQEVAATLFRVLTERHVKKKDHVLVNDAGVRDALWRSVVSRRLNRRIQGTIAELRAVVLSRLEEDVRETALPVPPWWANSASPSIGEGVVSTGESAFDGDASEDAAIFEHEAGT